jgi:putative NADH-flavin reductase
MKIVILGSSGQAGTVLARDFHAQGHEITVLSRSPLSSEERTPAKIKL